MTSTTTPAPGPAYAAPAASPAQAGSAAPTSLPAGTDTAPRVLRRRLPAVACVLLAPVLMYGSYLLEIPLSILLGHLVPNPGEVLTSLFEVLYSVVTLVTAIALVALVTRWVLRGRLRDIGFRWTGSSARMVGLGFVASAAVMLAATLLPVALGLSVRPGDQGIPKDLGNFLLQLVVQLFMGIALQALPEELLWRGWLMNCLAERPRLALVVSATVFGAMHWMSNSNQGGLLGHATYCVAALGFAFLGGALALRLRSLWCAVGVHTGIHLVPIALVLGGIYAQDSIVWLVQGLCMVALGIAVLWRWRGTRVSYVR